ncbi:MAG: exonuclease domain-containing protein [Clostridia bacterium]
MKKEKILELLNIKYNEKYENLILKDAKYNSLASCLFLQILYKDGFNIADNKDEIVAFIKKEIPEKITLDIKFTKSYIDEEILIKEVNNYILNSFPSLMSTLKIENINCGTENVDFTLMYDKRMESYSTARNLNNSLKEFLNSSFCYNFEIREELYEVDDSLYEDDEQDDFDFAVSAPENVREIIVKDISQYIGDLPQVNPMYIKDICEECDGVVVCGKIKFMKEYLTKPKPKIEGQAESKVNEERKYFKWVLKDFTNDISCIYFPTQTTLPKIEKIVDGSEVVITGRIMKDKFSNAFSLRVKAIALCILPTTFEEVVNYKPEPINYKYVMPAKVDHCSQTDIFSSAKEMEIVPFLQDKTFVVFDFETTGLEFLNSKIIEVGAVKIINGKISETFSSFINPLEKIPNNITELTSITDEDVEDAPTYPMVLQDFYKFTRGAVLVAHNITFDFGFLNYYGKDSGYLFDNELEDTLSLAMRYVKGIRNYKLKTVASKLNVSLENAHRAVNDAMATAEIFIKIAGLIV